MVLFSVWYLQPECPGKIGTERPFDIHLKFDRSAVVMTITALLAFATALLAAGMLAFALSFDEVIVTTFTAGQQQTLPIWMLEELVRQRQRPVTNVVAMVVVLVIFLPILGAFYLTRDGDQIASGGK